MLLILLQRYALIISLDAYYIESMNITKLNETSWNLTCQYKPLSNPNGCVITVECANFSDYHPQTMYKFYASDESENSSYSTGVTFHCDMLQCSAYIFRAYDVYLDNKKDISKNPAITTKNDTLCQVSQSKFAEMVSFL